MASKSKEARGDQKAYYKEKLKQRLAVLAERGVESDRIGKDPEVKRLRAEIRKTDARLKVIAGMEEKAAEMARLKAEKLAAPKKEKGKKTKDAEEASEMSKRQRKKKEKRERKATDEPGEANAA